MLLAAGELPTIFREDTVYILGLRFEQQTRAEVAITDAENITYLEEIIFDQTRVYAENHRINMRQGGPHYHQALRQNHPAFFTTKSTTCDCSIAIFPVELIGLIR